MKATEGKQQQFEVKIDNNGDFKITPKSPKTRVPTTTVVGTKQTLQGERQTKTKKTGTTTRRSSKKPPIRSRSFVPTGLSKKEIQKIRKNVSIQRISDYVRIVSPDDGIVNEKAFFGHIKWQMHKKYPERYLEVIKEKGIMVPCGEGKLKFTRRW